MSFAVVQVIELGKFIVDTWYYSPYPEPYASADKLYLCEFTLKYFRRKKTLLKHKAMLQQRHPPGTYIFFAQLQKYHSIIVTTLEINSEFFIVSDNCASYREPLSVICHRIEYTLSCVASSC